MKDLDYVIIHSVNPLYFIINKTDGFIEKEWRQVFNAGFYR